MCPSKASQSCYAHACLWPHTLAGLTDPGIQFPAYADFALENKLISKGLHDGMQFWSPVCTFATKLCNSLGWGWVCSLGQV